MLRDPKKNDEDDPTASLRGRYQAQGQILLGDDAIRGTNDDALAMKMSAVKQGYLDDPFVSLLMTGRKMAGPAPEAGARRPPLINRGTAVRTKAIDHLLSDFLTSPQLGDTKRQVINFGAGSDTRFFNLKCKGATTNLSKWVEIDFDQVVLKKAMALHKGESNALSNLLGPDVSISRGGTRLEASEYVLFGADLRSYRTEVIPALVGADSHSDAKGILDASLPTLLLFECVLPYISPSKGNEILSWASATFEKAGVIVYEMMVGEATTATSKRDGELERGDAFGRMMAANLAARRIPLPAMFSCPTPWSHIERFKSVGWTNAAAFDIDDIHDHKFHPKEVVRMNNLELLDELEEWKLLSKHYVIAYAWQGLPNWKWSFDNIAR